MYVLLCVSAVNPDMALMLNGVEYELDSRGMRPHVDVTGDVKVTILGVGYGAYTSTLLLDVVAAWYGKPAPRRGSYICITSFLFQHVYWHQE